MKHFTVILATIALLFSLRILVAQDASSVPVPNKESTGPGSLGAEPTPLPLMPETPSAPSERPHHSSSNGGGYSSSTSSGPGMSNPIKKNQTQENTEDVANRVKYREAKFKAMNDPQVQAALTEANAAKKELDKREAMRKYYTLLSAKILKIDGSLKKLVKTRLEASLKLLDQKHVRPEEYSE